MLTHWGFYFIKPSSNNVTASYRYKSKDYCYGEVLVPTDVYSI